MSIFESAEEAYPTLGQSRLASLDEVGDALTGEPAVRKHRTAGNGPEEGQYEYAKTVDHPAHYNQHPSGVECIDIIEHMPLNIGTAVKHLWRCDEKHPDPYEDLEKAVWYIKREILRRKMLESREKEVGSE